jgi:hypothetical protein
MPESSSTFTATIADWASRTEAGLEAIVKASATELFADIQRPVQEGGNLPVVTGTLRESLTSGIGTPTVEGADSYLAVVESAELGDTIVATYAAPYARCVHNGTSSMRGRPWITLAAMRWQAIVDAVVARIAR